MKQISTVLVFCNKCFKDFLNISLDYFIKFIYFFYISFGSIY